MQLSTVLTKNLLQFSFNIIFIDRKDAVNLLCKRDADFEKLRTMRNCQGKSAYELCNKEDTKFAFQSIYSCEKLK